MASRGGIFINLAGSVSNEFLRGIATLRDQMRLLREESHRLEVTTPGRGVQRFGMELQRSQAKIRQNIESTRQSLQNLVRQVREYNQALERTNRTALSPMRAPASGMAGAQVVGTQQRTDPRLAPFQAPAGGMAGADVSRQIQQGEQWTQVSTQAAKATRRHTEQLSLKERVLKGLNSIYERINARIRQFAAFVLAAMVIQGLKNAIRTTAQTISEFDQALRNLEAILNITRSQAQILGDVIKDVSRVTKFSAGEVAEGMRVLGQAGLDMQESIATVEAVARLATGTMTDFARVSDLMTTSIRAFKVEAVESGRIADIFANAINNSKLAVDKLITAFNYVGAAGYQAGLSINEVSGSLMVLADHGIRASTMGTGLRRMMLRMQSAAGGLAEDLQSIGMSVRDVNPEFVGWERSLENLIPLLWDTRTESVNVARAADYFGLRAAQVASVLIASVADGTNALSQAITQTREYGAASRMAETQIEGLSLSFKNLQDRVRLAAIAIGESGMGEFFQGLVDTLAQLSTAIERAFQEYGHLVGAFVKVAALTGVISLIGHLITKLGSVALASKAATVATVQLTAVFAGATTPIAAAKAGITALKAALLRFVSVTTLVIGGIVYALHKIEQAANKFGNLAREASRTANAFQASADGIQSWGDALTNAFGSAEWDETIQRFREIEVEGQNLSQLLEDELGYSLDVVPKKGAEGFRALQDAIKTVTIDQLEEQFSAATQQMDYVIKQSERLNHWFGVEIPDVLRESTEEASTLSRVIGFLGNSISEFGDSMMTLRMGGYEFGYAPLERWAEGAMDRFLPGSEELEDEVRDLVHNLASYMRSRGEVEDWTMEEAAAHTREQVEKLSESIDRDAGPILQKFISDMSVNWGAPAEAELQNVQNELLQLVKWVKEGESSFEGLQYRLRQLDLDYLFPDEVINSFEDATDAMQRIEGASRILEREMDTLNRMIFELFEGNKELAEVLEYVNEEMRVGEELKDRITRRIKGMGAAIDETISSYEVFARTLKDISPSILESFNDLTAGQRAELYAQRDELREVGNDMREFVEGIFGGVEFADIETMQGESPQEVKRKLQEVFGPHIETIEDVNKLIREKEKEWLQDRYNTIMEEASLYDEYISKMELRRDEQLLHLRDNTREALQVELKFAQDRLRLAEQEYRRHGTDENYKQFLDAQENLNAKRNALEEKYWSDRRELIEREAMEQLLAVEEGSNKELEIEREKSRRLLDLAEDRYMADSTHENLMNLYNAIKNHADRVLAVEKKLTDDLINEFERRIDGRERALRRELLDIERSVIEGQRAVYDAEGMEIQARLRNLDEEISERRELINTLKEQGDQQERIKELQDELEERRIERQEVQLESRRHEVGVYDEMIERINLAEQKRLVDVRNNSMEELRIRKEYAQAILNARRMAYEQRPEDRQAEIAYLQARRNLFDLELDIFEKHWDDRLTALEARQKEEMLQVESGSMEALRIEKKYAKMRLDEARAMFEEDETIENWINVLDHQQEMRDRRKAVEERITQDIVNETDKRIQILDREMRARELAFREDVIRGRMEEYDSVIANADLAIERIEREIEKREKAISKIDDVKANEGELKRLREELNELNLDLKESGLDRLDAEIQKADMLFEREKTIAEQRKELATIGIDRGDKALLESRRPGVIGTFGYQEKLAYEQVQIKVQAERELNSRLMELYDDRLREYKEVYGKDHHEYEQLLLEKELSHQRFLNRIEDLEKEKREAQIIAEGNFWERLRLGSERAQRDIEGWGEFTARLGEEMYTNFGSGFADAFVDFAIGAETAKEAFRSFAYDFFRNISQMIAQQLMFNALQGAMGLFGSSTSSIPNTLGGVTTATLHSGGIVGKDGVSRVVDPNIFANAPRFHKGLSSNEIPAILEKGERVVSKTDVVQEKRMLEDINRKLDKMEYQKQSQEKGTRIVNVLDPSLFNDWATSSSGEKVIKNFIKRNSSYIKQVIK